MTTTTTRSIAKKVTSAAVALVLGVSAVGAFAQPGPHRGDDRRHDQRNDRRMDDRRHDNRHNARPAPPRPAPHAHRDDRRGPPPHAYTRGAGPDHRWNRGDRVPPQYRTRSYVVDDWRGHRLSAPPRGYHWVQYGGDYLLVAVATGVIASLILNN